MSTASQKYKLVIVESPAKAKTIQKFLGSHYKVVASQGHLRDLPKSQLGVDPDDNFEMKYITIRGRGEILSNIRSEAKKAAGLFLATDPDREGEAISWHLAILLGIDPSAPCRVEFHEITKAAVKEAMTHPRPINMCRVDAQQARRALDRLVGYKISPLLWIKLRSRLSAGRVQSVATRMIVDRETEIQRFIPEEYWDVTASFKSKNEKGRTALYESRLVKLNGCKADIHTEESAVSARKTILGSSFTVQDIKLAEKQTRPQPPFTTSSLQQEASRKLNFTTAKTMQVVQQLYEGVELGKNGAVGLVTYIRTDSVRVSEEAIKAVRSQIAEKYGTEYLPREANVFKGRKSAQDAHEAIRPTNLEFSPANVEQYLTKDQYQLYRLIYTRFEASQMQPARYQTMTADLCADQHTLRYTAQHLKFDGYRLAYIEGSEDEPQTPESILPVIEKGDSIHIQSVDVKQRFTQPPPRYTEAALVKAMEEEGIGRPSTYAPTITTIISRGYVFREKKRLFPTELGCMVNDLMTRYFAREVDIGFTSDMEDQLDSVEEGSLEWRQILRDFYPDFDQRLQSAQKEIEKIEVADEVSDIPCEKCGAMMVYKMSRFGRFLACPNFPNCRNTQPIREYIDAPCPKCGSRLLRKISRKSRVFYGCEHYPDCDFVSWEKPVAEKCPKCNSYMVEKRGKGGVVMWLCANENCRYRIQAQDTAPQEE